MEHMVYLAPLAGYTNVLVALACLVYILVTLGSIIKKTSGAAYRRTYVRYRDKKIDEKRKIQQQLAEQKQQKHRLELR